MIDWRAARGERPLAAAQAARHVGPVRRVALAAGLALVAAVGFTAGYPGTAQADDPFFQYIPSCDTQPGRDTPPPAGSERPVARLTVPAAHKPTVRVPVPLDHYTSSAGPGRTIVKYCANHAEACCSREHYHGTAMQDHTYMNPGYYTPEIYAIDDQGTWSEEVKATTFYVNGRPTASFTYSTAAPVVGEVVTFTSTSTDHPKDVPSETGPLSRYEWDLDGDGVYNDPEDRKFGSGRVPTARDSISAPGTTGVRRGVWSNKGTSSGTIPAQATMQVGARPGGTDTTDGLTTGGPGTTGSGFGSAAGTTGDRLVSSNSLSVLQAVRSTIRTRARVGPRSSRFVLVSVRASSGAVITLRCIGRGCPRGSQTRRARSRTLRFERFERRLWAGAILEIFVTKRNMMGRYVRFSVRPGVRPARTDTCLLPGTRRRYQC